MATYTTVSKSTEPHGPEDAALGSTMSVSEGDIFFVDATANSKTGFEAAGASPADFDVQFIDSNVDSFTLDFDTGLNPTIDIAAGIDALDVDITAKNADSLTLKAGDDTTCGSLIGSDVGAERFYLRDTEAFCRNLES